MLASTTSERTQERAPTTANGEKKENTYAYRDIPSGHLWP